MAKSNNAVKKVPKKNSKIDRFALLEAALRLLLYRQSLVRASSSQSIHLVDTIDSANDRDTLKTRRRRCPAAATGRIHMVYDRAGYDLSVDYGAELNPAPSNETTAWLQEPIRDAAS